MTQTITRTMDLKSWVILVTVGTIWGCSFYLYTITLKSLPVFTIVVLRVGIAALVLWAVVAISPDCKKSPWPSIQDIFVLGLVNIAIPYSLIVYGETVIPGGLAAILCATTPFFTVFIANAFTRDEKLSWNKVTGCLIGLLGVATMVGIGAFASGHETLLPQLAVVGAALCYALGTVYARRFSKSPPMVIAAGQLSTATLWLLPMVVLVERPWTLPAPPLSVWAAILILALVCTALAYAMFFTLLRKNGATNLTLVTFISPVSAVLLGIAFNNEIFHWYTLTGMAAIGLGLALIDGRPLAALRKRLANHRA